MTDAPPAFARAVRDPGSFRDPSGFVYRRDGVLYRQVNQSFATAGTTSSHPACSPSLQSRGLLVPHETAPIEAAADPGDRPRGHPTGADHVRSPTPTSGRSDAQGRGAGDARRAGRGRGARLRPPRRDRLQRPVPPRPADPHRHALVRAAGAGDAVDRLPPVLRALPRPARADGPARRPTRAACCATTSTGSRSTSPPGSCPDARAGTWGLGAHIHAHARAQGRYADAGTDAAAATKKATVSEFKQQALIDSLRRTIAKLEWTPEGTEWADYADNTSYGDAGTAAKEELVGRFLADAGGAVVWDLGANTGRYSRIAAGLGRDVVVVGHRPGRGRAQLPPGPARRRRARPAARARPRQPQPGPRLGERGAALRARARRTRTSSSRSPSSTTSRSAATCRSTGSRRTSPGSPRSS